MEQFCALLAVAMRRHMWVKVQGIKHRRAHALTHTRLCTHPHTQARTHPHTQCTHTSLHTCVCTPSHGCTHILQYAYAWTHLHIRVYACHTCMHTPLNTHALTPTRTYLQCRYNLSASVRGLQQRQVPGIAVVCHRQGRGIKDERWRVPFVSCGPVNYLETLMGFPPRCHLHFLLEFTFGDAVARNLAQDRDQPNPLMCV